jgi:hypothetical protein
LLRASTLSQLPAAAFERFYCGQSGLQSANKSCGNVIADRHFCSVRQSDWDSAFIGPVLIVEDEPFIRMMLAEMLAEVGHTIAG